jgi:hypothetical protein
LAAEAVALMVNMLHNHQVAQQVAVAEEVHTQQAAEAEALEAQAEEHGDKIKSILGECTQVILHTHQQQMKDLLKADQEWAANHQVHSQQLADKVGQDFTE